MKRFVIGVCALLAILALTHSIHAQTPAPKTPIPVKSVVGNVTDSNGKKIAQVTLPPSGRTEFIRLPSGIRVAVNMQNGRAVSAQAVSGTGGNLTAEVRNQGTARHRTIIIIIRSGGTVVVVVIRT